MKRHQTSQTALSSPHQGTGITLDTEPMVGFDPLLAGMARPGSVQPVSAHPLLEEEPAVWPQLAT